MTHRSQWIAGACAMVCLGTAGQARALTFGTFGNWDTQARRDAAINAMTIVCNRFNAYGDFNWGSDGYVDVYYNAGVPTAQASWYGAMTFGGTYPNERVTLHEMNHWLGSVYGHDPNGPRAVAILEQFDGVGARYGNDGTHFWPYGMNYDNEFSEVAAQRNIAIMYAFRRDWGIGNPADPTAWAATSVTLTGSDAVGESGFNFASKWSDNTFAHYNADYTTGNFLMRTPASGNGFKFAGASLTVNNANGINGGLLYKGSGTTAVTTINNLTLDNGYVRHASGTGDLFQLDGSITVKGAPVIDAAQGNIRILAAIGGSGSLTTQGAYTTTLSAVNTYTGGTNVNAGTLVLNAGGTSGAIRGTLNVNSGATVRLGAADALGTGTLTSVTQINVNNGTVDNASAGANGYNANWSLTGGTLSSTGSGAYHVNAGGGKGIATLASGNSSAINANLVIRGANATLPITVADGAAANDLVIRGAISNSTTEAGNNGVTKTGAGTLLLAGANTYSGTTTVSAGTLGFATSTSNIGPVTVADAAALRVLAINANATTLNAVALTLGDGGTTQLAFDLAGLDTNAVQISTGTLTANGTVNVSVENGGALSSGQHTLIGYTGFAGDGTFVLGSPTLGPRSTGTLVNNGTSALLLDVVADRPVWTGGDNGNWAAGLNGSLKNWKLQTAGTATDYLQGDNVLFDDTATGPSAITISGGAVAPAVVTFNNSIKPYTIAGGFGIGGNGALVKNGTNTLTINTPNTYTGGTTLNAGTLVAGHTTALGTGGLRMNGATFASTSSTTIAGTLTVTGNNTLGNAGQNGNITINGGLAGNGTLTNFVGSASNYNVIFNGDSGAFTGSLVHTNSSGTATGWWRFGQNNTVVNLSNASLVINKGNLANLNAASKNVGFGDNIIGATLKIGALSGDGVFQASFSNSGPNTLEVGALNLNTVFSGVIAGGDGGTQIHVTKVGTGTLTLSGANRYTGTTTINGGTIVATANASIGADTAPVVLDGGTLKTTAGIATARSITVGPNGGTLNIASTGTAGTGQLFLSSANALLGGGPLLVTGNGSLNTTGAGNLRIGGNNSYSGTATVRDGGIFEYGTAGAVGGGATFVLGNEGELAVQGYNNTGMPNAVTVSGGTNSVISFENSGGGNVTGPITLNANLTVALRNWYNYNTVQNGTISGVIGGAGNVSVNSGNGTGGVLTLSGNNTFTGNLTVEKATVAATLGINDFTTGGRASGAFGNEKIAGRTVTINNGGTVSLAVGNVLGSGGSSVAQAPALAFVVNAGGTLNTAAPSVGGSGGGDANILGNLTLNGGSLVTGNGYDANYQAVILLKNVNVGGTSASTITSNASNTTANGVMLGDSANGVDTITFTVSDATGNANADLVVSARLTNSANSASNLNAIGALVKAGPGTMSLTAANTYTGGTTIQNGTLAVKYTAGGASAATPLLNGSGANLQNGRIVFDYTGSSTPAAAIRTLLAASFQAATTPGVMETGTLRSTTATAARGLGYADDGAGNVIVMATLYGDADLDGGVSINDFNTLAGNFGQSTGKVWVDGDFDYDGGVSINDFNLLAAGFAQTVPPTSEAWAGLLAFATAHNDLVAFEAVTGVPEPTSVGLLTAGATLGLRRRRRV